MSHYVAICRIVSHGFQSLSFWLIALLVDCFAGGILVVVYISSSFRFMSVGGFWEDIVIWVEVYEFTYGYFVFLQFIIGFELCLSIGVKERVYFFCLFSRAAEEEEFFQVVDQYFILVWVNEVEFRQGQGSPFGTVSCIRMRYRIRAFWAFGY